MKKLGLVLAILLSLSSITFAYFSDVDTNSPYFEAVNGLYEKNIINGYGDNTFMPTSKITRAEFVKMIVTATESTGKSQSSFSDVAENHWAREYIENAVANGYIKGYEDNTFKPENNITYGEVVTVILRAMGYEEQAEALKMAWPDNYMHLAEEQNLFAKYPTNDLLADNEALRGNVALMLWNMLQKDVNVEDNNNDEETVDTKLLRVGFVIATKERRGENFVTIEDEEKEIEYKLYSKSSEPVLNSFIVYQLNEDNELKLKKQLLLSEIENVSKLVTNADDTLIKLDGEDKLLDLELDTFTLNDVEINLNKYSYYFVEMDSENNEYVSIQEKSKDSLSLKENDRICFDSEVKICLIIRDISK